MHEVEKGLSPSQLQFFEENGYLVVENVFDQKNVIQPIRDEYSELMDELYQDWFRQGLVSSQPDELNFYEKLLDAYKAGCDWFQPMDISLPGDRIHADTPMHFGPAVFALLINERLLDIVGSLIGREITSNPIQHVRIKPPTENLRHDEVRAHVTTTDWHQDRGVTHEEADETSMVTVWCAITDATVDNGCLQVIPGGHKQGMKPHCPKTQTAIATGFIEEADAVPVPVESGGVVLFHPLVPHSSLPNTTTGFRWSFDIRYNKTGEPTGRSHFPAFIASSLEDPSWELRDWRAWRALWLDARSRLSAEPHIDIHRWASDAPYCA